MAQQGITDEYLVQELNINGDFVGQPLRLEKAGWGEDNEWTYMENGCVVFPFTWKEGDTGPGGNFPTYGEANSTKKLYLTSICPENSSPYLNVSLILIISLLLLSFL